MVVVGGGSAGAQAVDVAVGMGARVTVARVTVVDINTDASVLVGAVLVPGAKAPKVIDDAALDANPHLAQGVNVRGGEVVLEAIKTKT